MGGKNERVPNCEKFSKTRGGVTLKRNFKQNLDTVFISKFSATRVQKVSQKFDKITKMYVAYQGNFNLNLNVVYSSGNF